MLETNGSEKVSAYMVQYSILGLFKGLNIVVPGRPVQYNTIFISLRINVKWTNSSKIKKLWIINVVEVSSLFIQPAIVIYKLWHTFQERSLGTLCVVFYVESVYKIWGVVFSEDQTGIKEKLSSEPGYMEYH